MLRDAFLVNYPENQIAVNKSLRRSLKKVLRGKRRLFVKQLIIKVGA